MINYHDHSISLTTEEEKLFGLLLGCLSHFKKTTTLRVAGGWVRDKLLGKESHDIDIALDDLSGLDFANLVNEYLLIHGLETHTIAVIQANPDQSKHLETANLRVLGFDIDCVNLRAESYADSRIPEIRIGTAEEDALRRDFTINALFFNIHNRLVEDFTGKGLEDLSKKFIRTPLSPFITFKDDPLRVLRAIRFSSRLHFHLCPELIAAASDKEIKSAFMTKVSRERIYKECDGMIIHKECRPAIAFALLYRLQMLDGVLPVHQLLANHIPVSAAIETIYYIDILLHMRDRNDFNSSIISEEILARPHSPMSSNHIKALYWAANVYSLGEVVVLEKKKEVSFVHVLLRDGVKMENVTMRQIQTLIETALQFISIGHPDNINVHNAGHLVRTSRELWRDCLILATAIELTSLFILHQEPSMAAAMEYDLADAHLSPRQMDIIRKYRGMEEVIDRLNLDKIWELKPIFDGSELIKLLGLPKGPLIGKVLEEQIMWQIVNDRSEDREACLQHLQATFPPPQKL
eukprot:gene361-390_t